MTDTLIDSNEPVMIQWSSYEVGDSSNNRFKICISKTHSDDLQNVTKESHSAHIPAATSWFLLCADTSKYISNQIPKHGPQETLNP